MRIAGGILSVMSAYILATMMAAASRNYDAPILDGGLTFVQHLAVVAPWTGIVFGFLIIGVTGIWMMTRNRNYED